MVVSNAAFCVIYEICRGSNNQNYSQNLIDIAWLSCTVMYFFQQNEYNDSDVK
jgi:hypothetical protein